MRRDDHYVWTLKVIAIISKMTYGSGVLSAAVKALRWVIRICLLAW